MVKLNDLVAKFNQLQDALSKVCELKDHYKNEFVSLSGSLTDNVSALKEANKIIKGLEKEANDLAESISLDKDTIIAAARESSTSADISSRATVPPFSVEDNTIA